MNLCIIPARGGSKRIPRKNIREFCGKPMIAWSIEAALASECFANVIVSTDDDEIASIALDLGAQVPFRRPSVLADDYSGTTDVVLHSIDWAEQAGLSLEAICCLYATAPFVTADVLRDGLQLLGLTDDDRFVFTATTYASPIQRALRVDSDGLAHMFNSSQFIMRSQDLEDAYHDAGQFYWGYTQSWRSDRPLFEASRPLILPRWRVLDIDTQEDWVLAEGLFRFFQDQNLNFIN